VNRIDRKHYLHDFSYIVPFLTKDIFSNFSKIKKKITNFHEDVKAEINKIEEYLKELYKVEGTVKNQILLLELEEERGKIKNYLDKMTKFISNYRQGQKLKEELDDVMFLSAQQCQKK
jgi:3-methyladenine DNA glycosylase Tag